MHDEIHSMPAAWRTVVVEQVRLVGLRFRIPGAVLFALAVSIAAAFVRIMVSANAGVVAIHDKLALQPSGPAHARLVPTLQAVHVIYSPAISVVVAALALVLPLAMWQDEPPTERGYHLVMPMRASTHTLLRVLSGWTWMMVITAVYLALIVASIGVMSALSPSQVPVHLRYTAAWEWLIPFTAVTITYLFASTAAVGARRPLVWLGGTVAAYAGAVVLLRMLQMPHAAEWLLQGYVGEYGAAAALTGQVEGAGGISSLGRWLGSTMIWGLAAAALLFTTANRRAEG